MAGWLRTSKQASYWSIFCFLFDSNWQKNSDRPAGPVSSVLNTLNWVNWSRKERSGWWEQSSLRPTLYSLVCLLNPIVVILPTGSPYPIPTPGLHQSCRHVVRSWANQSFGAHLHNMTLTNGKLRVPQDGRYYLYSQVITLCYSGLRKVDWVWTMPLLNCLSGFPLTPGVLPLPVTSSQWWRPAQCQPPAGAVCLQENVLSKPHTSIFPLSIWSDLTSLIHSHRVTDFLP